MAKDLFGRLNKVEEELTKFRREKEKIALMCNHRGKNGKLKLDQTDDHGGVRCKVCGNRFNIKTISDNELGKAIEVLHNAIQQARAFSKDKDGEKNDRGTIVSLGELDYNNQMVREIYSRVLRTKSNKKKNKKDNRRDNEYGGYDRDLRFGR